MPYPGGCPTSSDKILPDLLPARMLNEFTYCPRLFFLEWVDSEFADSADTVEGRVRHRRVDRESGTAPPTTAEASGPSVPGESASTAGDAPGLPGAVSADADGADGGALAARAGSGSGGPDAIPVDGKPVDRATALMLSAPEHGLIAKIDLVEFHDGEAVPIDYKKGTLPDVPEGAWEPERVQLCAQGLVLRAAGHRSERGQIYYAGSNRRVTVPFDEALIARTLDLAAEARRVASEGRIPPPLADSPKCPRCSLVGICLPDEVRFLSAGRAEVSPDDVRRLFPARDDRSPLYVQSQGAYLSKHGETIQVREGRTVVEEVRLLDLSQVNLYGAVQVSTQLIQELCRWEVPVCYFSFGGWFHGVTTGLGHRNVELRRGQFRAAEDRARCLRLAARFVRGKILNCRTLLRRNLKDIPRTELRELARLSMAAGRAPDLATLLGLEGAAARLYFSRFGEMLRPPEPDGRLAFDFNGRNRRPPKDPVNTMLSFLYAVLTKEAHLAVLGVGFDPFLGFYHQPRYGRPALALDLMEEFRPIVVDSVVLQLVNTGEIRGQDFLQRGGACTLTPAGRKRVLGAFERRMESTIIHPLFGYAASYRRILEIQARLLGRWLAGEIAEYPPFRTR